MKNGIVVVLADCERTVLLIKLKLFVVSVRFGHLLFTKIINQ